MVERGGVGELVGRVGVCVGGVSSLLVCVVVSVLLLREWGVVAARTLVRGLRTTRARGVLECVCGVVV